MTKDPRMYNGERKVFSVNGWKNWIAICKRVKLDHYLTPYIKVNSKLIKYLHIRPEITKYIEENRDNKLLDISLSNVLWIWYSVSKGSKTKINKWDYIKLKSFWTAKETINKTKRHTTEWEMIFANDNFQLEVNMQNIYENAYNSKA